MRNFCEVGLGRRHEKIFSLGAVDRVAESPSTESFIAIPMSTLGEMPGQTRTALAAWGDGSDQHAVADVVAGHAGPKFLNDTDRFMPDDQSGSYRILPPHDVQVRAADRGQGHADHGLADAGMRSIHL